MKCDRKRLLWLLSGALLAIVVLMPVASSSSEATSVVGCDLEAGATYDFCAGASSKGTFDPNSKPPCAGASDDCGSGGIAY